jgi:hypothetical protein
MAGGRAESSLSFTEGQPLKELEMNAHRSLRRTRQTAATASPGRPARRARRPLAATAIAALAALSIAGPAQAALVGGVTNGGCTTGLQVGHITHPDGSYTPICQTFG